MDNSRFSEIFTFEPSGFQNIKKFEFKLHIHLWLKGERIMSGSQRAEILSYSVPQNITQLVCFVYAQQNLSYTLYPLKRIYIKGATLAILIHNSIIELQSAGN